MPLHADSYRAVGNVLLGQLVRDDLIKPVSMSVRTYVPIFFLPIFLIFVVWVDVDEGCTMV